MFSCLNWWYALWSKVNFISFEGSGWSYSWGRWPRPFIEFHSAHIWRFPEMGLPLIIHFRFGFSINQRFWGSPIYGNPHVASNWFSHIISTSVPSKVSVFNSEISGTSKGSVVKSSFQISNFRFLPKVQVLPNFRYFQFQVLHYLIMEKSSVPSCRNLAVRKWWKPPTSTGESSCSPIHMPCLRIFSDIFCFTNSTGWSSITESPACSLLTCNVFRGYLRVQLRIIINKN